MLSVPYSVTPRLLLELVPNFIQFIPSRKLCTYHTYPARPATGLQRRAQRRTRYGPSPVRCLHWRRTVPAQLPPCSHGQLDALLVARKVKETSAAGIQTSRRTASPMRPLLTGGVAHWSSDADAEGDAARFACRASIPFNAARTRRRPRGRLLHELRPHGVLPPHTNYTPIDAELPSRHPLRAARARRRTAGRPARTPGR